MFFFKNSVNSVIFYLQIVIYKRRKKCKKLLLSCQNISIPALISAGYVLNDKIKIFDGLTGLKFNDDGKLAYRKYIKPKGKRLFHKAGIVIRNLKEIESIRFSEYNKTRQDFEINFWTLKLKTKTIKPEVTKNEKLNGIEIRFSSKPDKKTLENLKSNGWRWSNYNQCWYNRNTCENLKFANNL